ncbi:hypothetical protein MW887_007328 [Aspergillus wentii]|nr:hypothetical protein MW887_007328 [Aspergillus wentii]
MASIPESKPTAARSSFPAYLSPSPFLQSDLDRSSWGVRFNQVHQAPPPLPPRPSSAADNPHARLQTPAAGSPNPNNNKPLPATPNTGCQPLGSYPQWTTSPPPYTPQHNVNLISSPLLPAPPAPPHPPQVPPYLDPSPEQNNQTWQQSPLVERPQPQSPPTNQGLMPAVAPPPVPPKSPHFHASASALGIGTPSDWEHLGPSPGHIDDEEVFQPKKDTPAPPGSVFELPPNHSTAESSPALNNQIATSTPPQSISPLMHTTQNDYSQGPQKRSASSPVSPSVTQEIHEPPRPARVDTAESSYSTMSATDPSESIDGVIEAWTRPISPETKSSAAHTPQESRSNSRDPPRRKPSPLEIEIPKHNSENIEPPREMHSASNEEEPNHTAEDSVKAEPVVPQPKGLDPYGDMDPWFKSSLARYTAMLRKETVADSDEERFKIFTAFMAKETKLREILYSIENELKSDDQTTPQIEPISQQSTEKSEETASPIESGLIPVESENTQGISSNVREGYEDGEYSPGGRPLLPRLHTPVSHGLQRSASNPTGLANALKHARTGNPPVADSQTQSSRSTSVPPSISENYEEIFRPLSTNPPQAIYTPFRYTEGPQRGSDSLKFDQPAYQAYSALRQASAESGRVMSNGPAPTTKGRSGTATPAPAQAEHDETFIGLIREKSVAYRKRPRRKTSSPPPLPMSLRQGRADSLTELRSIISTPLSKHSESSWHATTRKDLEKYSDDFTYIQSALNGWEAKNRVRREALDKERMRRQEESERRIDDLFNEKEIGYADINVLEDQYRQTEARVQLDEERRELDDFNVNAFNPLDRRLREEISALRDHYDSALGQLDHENSRIKDSAADKYNLSFTMKTVNEIYRMLEMRYQKRLGIALDRERRRKKTERRPLVFMGDTLGLKRLDADFDRMEKRNILEATKDRDERANRLMDSFDSAVMHGLGENQSLLDEVSTKLKKISPAVIRSSGLSDSEIDQILRSISTLVGSLRMDSESILHNFGIADSTLNDADYSVSVAEARYSNSDVKVFRRLDNEKKKEDAKIQSELDSKLESVRNGPAEIISKINDLLRSLGKDPVIEEPNHSTSVPGSHPVDVLLPGSRPPTASMTPRIPDEDHGHQQRLRKALENAKKRNATRNNP